MIKRFSVFSYVVFSAIGAFNEQLISELINKNIKIRNINVKDNVLYGEVKRKDYKSVARIAHKFNIRTKVLKRRGIYFKLKSKKTHNGILYGAFCGIVLILIMQNFIWKVEIHNSDNETDNLIKEISSACGIRVGGLISSADDKSTEILLKKSLSGASWINVELNGSRADIYIQKSSDVKKKEISGKTPCNVIAAKTGIIVETEVYSGTLIYPKGSGVSEGSVIVSGVVNDGADNIILTHANAKIIADFTERVEFRQEYVTVEKIKTDIIENEKELMLFGFVIPISERINDKTNKVCRDEIRKCELFGLDLPFKVKTNSYTTYNNSIVSRTTEDSLRLIEQQLEQYCNNFLSEYEIIDLRKSYKYDEKGITLVADIDLRGDISLQQKIY